MHIGLKIREYRKDRSLTQDELAELSGVALMTISQYERGKRQPQVAQLQKLATALKINVEQLLDGEGVSTQAKKTQPLPKKLIEILRSLLNKRDDPEIEALINNNDFQLFITGLLGRLIKMDEDKQYSLMKLLDIFIENDLSPDEMETLEIINIGLCSITPSGQENVCGYISGVIASSKYQKPTKEDSHV
jgi:transcriptional regulator with XRE-family HTH domain